MRFQLYSLVTVYGVFLFFTPLGLVSYMKNRSSEAAVGHGGAAHHRHSI